MGAWRKQMEPSQVVLEATGGDALAAPDALHTAGLPRVRANPRQARDVAKDIGHLAQTDRLDARVLAMMATVLPLDALPAAGRLAPSAAPVPAAPHAGVGDG
ncbi:hypothetical protein XpopCFBP1817_20940, partial [Xanthomonas populi]